MDVQNVPRIYVPTDKGHPACSIVLASVDDSIGKARLQLASALGETDASALADAWRRYDACVVEADAVYRCLDAIAAALEADLAPARDTTSGYINHVLGVKDHALTLALSSLAQCGAPLCVLAAPQRNSLSVVAEAARSVAAALADVMREVRAHGPQFVKPFSASERVCAQSWRDHGFQTAASYDAQPVGRIPPSTERHLIETVGMRWITHRGSCLMTVGWRNLNARPVGVRLGMAARYTGANQNLTAVMLFEQVLIAAHRSLFDDQLYHRLTVQLNDMPNAQLPADAQVPLVAIMYSVRTHTADSESDLTAVFDGVPSTDALRRAVDVRLNALGGRVSTDEECQCVVPSINFFLGLSVVWYAMAEKMTLDADTMDRASHGWSEERRSLYFILRALVDMRGNKQELKLIVRVLWWMRYARRGNASERAFWTWTIDRARMMRDLAALSGSNTFFGGATWSFSPEKMGLDAMR